MATKNNRIIGISPLFKWLFNGLQSVVLLCLLGSASFAQTLHAVVFADTEDKQIGPSVYMDYKSMLSEMNTIASTIRMPIYEHFYYGKDFRNKKLEEVLDNMKIGSEDIVLVYISSHGGRSERESCAYPQIAFPPFQRTDFYEFYSLCQIDKALARKNPRFYMVMGDLCNNVVAGLPPKDELPKGSTFIKSTSETAYKHLFSEVKGSVIVTSSEAGQQSIALTRGGAFTVCFLNALQVMAAGGKGDWNELMKNAKYCTEEVVKSLGTRKVQNPFFEVRVQTTGGSTPAPVAESGTTEHINEGFMESVRRLADVARGEEWRIKNAKNVLQSHFAPNARIEIVGRNMTTVVATETADKFLRRLSTSFKLVNIVELECEKDSAGKIVFLKVHEIYKQ